MKPTVLVADDEASIRSLMRIVLEQEGFQVRTASDGHEVLRRLTEEDVPDLLILDLRMPGPGGHEILDFIDGSPELRSLPTLVLSGLADLDPDLDTLEAAPHRAVLAKPADLDRLVAVVRRLVAGTSETGGSACPA